MPGTVIVKAGTLDDLSDLKPVVELYAMHALAWPPHADGVKRFDRSRT